MHICSEILRIIDSVQLTDSHKVATPVDWKVCSPSYHQLQNFTQQVI